MAGVVVVVGGDSGGGLAAGEGVRAVEDAVAVREAGLQCWGGAGEGG